MPDPISLSVSPFLPSPPEEIESDSGLEMINCEKESVQSNEENNEVEMKEKEEIKKEKDKDLR